MAEKKSVGHAYNIDFLNVVFAASSVFLFVCVIWMVWDDFDREWKNTQRRFNQLEIEVTRANLEQAKRGVDKRKLDQMESQRKDAEKQVTSNQQKVEEIEKRLADIDARLYRETQDMQFTKATYDVKRYAFEVERSKNPNGVEKQQKAVEDLEKKLQDYTRTVEKTTAEKAQVQQELGKYTGRLGELAKQIEETNAEQTRLGKRLDVLAPSLVKDYFRNAPLLDFMAPTIKVQQIITPNVVDDVNFTRVAKMDRCMTCHLAIDKKGYEKYPQPFTTHPNLSYYVGSDSPHPLESTGCTVCHEGMGNSVTFTGAIHTPRDAKQAKEWEEKYHWEHTEFWDYPMLPTPMTEASCAKCHKAEVYVPHATTLETAYATYERAGCYACHKTRGFENLRKPGPTLTHIKSKLTPDWVKNWVRNPRAVKPATWMPRPWYNSNSNSPADYVRNEVEINAAVAYLFANQDEYQLPVATPPKGDPKNGEQIIKSIGCLGCHVVEETDRSKIGPRRTFGQPLENIGNKTTYEWLYNWVRDPKHYNPDTYMPDLRLTDQQTADVATYLTTLKGAAGDGPKATPSAKDVDDVLLTYLMATLPAEEARTQLGKLDGQRKELELGQRVIARYGCFSCHDIKGFEKAQPIGTELSEEGTKLVSRLDFGFVDTIRHGDKLAWFHQKVRDPRIFDKGKVLQPLEKLRMPDYMASDEEADRLVTAIMSLQKEIQPAQAMPARAARRDNMVSGRNFVQRRNCVSCHNIEGAAAGGEFVKLVTDPSLAPPGLTPEGARVQADWLYAFLRGPITIRPWLNVRMPTFGFDDPSLNRVIRYFEAVSDKMDTFQTHEVVKASAQNNLAGEGAQLFTVLKCQACHVLGEIPKDQPTANLAPDLRMAPERLQPDWIIEWLKNPARILPGTRMPQFWPEYPKSPYPQLNGDGVLQVRSIRDHLMTLHGGPSPKRSTTTTTAAAHP
jgi:mono/diheme cytochrome c family protein